MTWFCDKDSKGALIEAMTETMAGAIIKTVTGYDRIGDRL
jgi:hypothetical protein